MLFTFSTCMLNITSARRHSVQHQQLKASIDEPGPLMQLLKPFPGNFVALGVKPAVALTLTKQQF